MPRRPPPDGPGHRPAEDGLSLIELLVTLVIVGSAFVILVGGTLTGVIVSNTHREKADGEIVLRRFIDEVKAAPYAPCPATAYIPSEPAPDWAQGFGFEVEKCAEDDDEEGEPPLPPGIQKLRLAVEPTISGGGPPGNARLEVQIVKRDEGS